jgi:hypothetical protein
MYLPAAELRSLLFVAYNVVIVGGDLEELMALSPFICCDLN